MSVPSYLDRSVMQIKRKANCRKTTSFVIAGSPNARKSNAISKVGKSGLFFNGHLLQAHVKEKAKDTKRLLQLLPIFVFFAELMNV